MATTFVRRLTAPSSTNKYYIRNNYDGVNYGGYNKCMVINLRTGSVLPNCTGYAWGRFCEEQGIHNCKLSRGNAGNWYDKNDGYRRGSTPKLGAVICWYDTKGAGHVAIVEKVYDNGNILTSNSAYNGKRFYQKQLTRVSNYFMGATYHFQGFIYPDVDFVDPDTPIPPEPYVSNKVKKFPWFIYSRRLRKSHLTH